MSRTNVRAYYISRADLEQWLIDQLHLPEDIVVTNIVRAINQEAIVIMIQSRSFPEMHDLDMVGLDQKWVIEDVHIRAVPYITEGIHE